MKLLWQRPVSKHPDDGIQTEYECQACYASGLYVMDPYDVPEDIGCLMCGHYEGNDEE